MTTIVVGDIHNRVDAAEYITHKHPNDTIVFMGDYFDSFYDTPEMNENTARWLKQSLTYSNRVHLMGNHDYSYNPTVPTFLCSGFTTDKCNAINKVLTVADWNKLKYLHIEQGWWLSHAGITDYWFRHPILDITEDLVQTQIKDALISRPVTNKCLCAVGHRRGGEHYKGGILWNDWNDIDYVNDNIKQIVGHTPSTKVRFSVHANAYCVDAVPYQYISITDGFVTIHDIPSNY